MSRALLVLVGGLLLGLAAFLVVDDGRPGGIAEAALSPTTSTTSTVTTTSITMPPSSTIITTVPTSTSPDRGSLVIHGVGDVNTDTSYIPALSANGHEHAWSGLDGLFAADDLTVVNLECTPSALGEPLRKEFVFRCDPASLPVMAASGVEVVNLANNHSGDHGKAALLDGLQNVTDAGLAPVGV
ncbi:MAG TPA: CapA family protein, partial [Acidimicrobiia bacterium]|nr:CapA family protein [Acidimicrobiia bacterium]